jgi:hypothetical protein
MFRAARELRSKAEHERLLLSFDGRAEDENRSGSLLRHLEIASR